MDREDVVAIIDYLTRGIYPGGLSKSEKRSMRKRCSSFVCINGVLYHKGKKDRHRLVVCDLAERRRIMETMHQNSNNGKSLHNGINITANKVTDCYWWRGITEDVRNFCRSCSKCSHLFPANHVNSTPESSGEIQSRQEEVGGSDSPPVGSVSGVESKELNWTSHSSELLSALHELFKRKICCDVVLSAGGFQVSTHKVILMATSDYLKSLIDDRGSTDEVIDLTNICGLCLEPVISFLYSGSLKLSLENVNLMMSTANQLGISTAVALCQQFLELPDDIKFPDLRLQNEKTEGKIYEPVSTEKSVEKNLGDIFPKASECVPDEFVILDIKEEVPNGSFFSSEGLDGLVPFEAPARRGRPRKNRGRKKCLERDRLVLKNCSSVSDKKEAVDSGAVQKRYNTRSVSMQSVLSKSLGAKSLAPRSIAVKAKELVKSRRRKMSRILLSTHGKRHVCYICESSFKFVSGLTHHLVQRHGIPRLDLALFRLSRLSVRCAVEFDWHRKIASRSCQNSASSLPQSNVLKNSMPPGRDFLTDTLRRSHTRTCWHGKLYSAWCRLVKHEKSQSQAKKTQLGSTSSLTFRNRCGWCAKTFLRRADLLEHRQLVHRRHKELPVSNRAREKRARSDWNCKEKGCAAPLKTKEALKDHMASAHPAVFLSCPHCRYKTQVEHYLKRHLVRRHKDRYLCPICSKPYYKKFLLKVHMYNQHKVTDPSLQLHYCPHEGCNYACPGKSALQTHMQKHTVAKPFTCHICGKDFKRALSLDKHINKIHLGIRSHICDKCGTSCCDEADLKRHLLKHEKNKTYACSICGFSTFHRLVFQSHMFCRHQIVDEKMRLMKCDQCKFVTNKKYRFNDHVKMHKNIRDIPCPECGKSFVTQKTMRQHIVKVHKQTTQCCDRCPFKALTVRKLQEHIALMHDLADPRQQCVDSAATSCADARRSSFAGDISAPYPNVLTMTRSDVATTPHIDVCLATYADVSLTLPSGVGTSNFPIVQSTLLGERCATEFPEILQPSVNCDIVNIPIVIDKGFCQFDPYGAR